MVAWSPDGTRLAWISPLLGFGSGIVQVGDAFYSRNILTCPIPSPSQAFAIAWSTDSTRIASCNNDGSVQILDAATGSCLLVYQPPMNDDEVSAIAWSTDGMHIASSYDSGYVQVWNATNGSLVYQQSSISPIQVISLAWSPDGTRIVSSIDSDNSGVQVWNTTNGENIFTYRGHTDLVTSVAWSPDGKRIASGSYDKTVQVWDAP
jgi:WD40 repeat protein